MNLETPFQHEVNPSAAFSASQDAQSDLGDGSSSLSDIEDKEADQDDNDEADMDQDIEGDQILDNEEDNNVDLDSDGNDSEAETERLENSPHIARRHRDVVMSSHTESRTYERSPSKLYISHPVDEEDEDEDLDDLSDEEGSIDDPANGTTIGAENEAQPSTVTSMEDSGELPASFAIQDSFNKKRKRSLLPERRSPDPDELDEPASKRTGSILGHGDDFAIDDTASGHEENGTSNAVSGELSDVESDPEEGKIVTHVELKPTNAKADGIAPPAAPEDPTRTKLERHRRSKSRKSAGGEDAGASLEPADNDNVATTKAQVHMVEEEEQEAEVDNEADEAEATLRNEEEQERKRASLDLLSNIQKQFDAFKKTLYEERMAQLDREEALLRSDPPTHPQCLEMMKCIDARRDDKLKVEANLTKYKLESMQRTAVATRAQILAQYSQQVQEIRERVLEKTGKMWYDIQNDRRGYGSQVEEYAIRFPTRRSQQVMHHNQYTKEISLLSGIAKHVGFPAAPKMNGASQHELAADLEKMGKSTQPRHVSHRVQTGLPDLAALRAASSTSSFRPAEEQFIEQTPWANPQHPSHAHLIQRQSHGHQGPRIVSPFGFGVGGRKQAQSGPPLGLFSGGGIHISNGTHAIGGAASPVHTLASTSYQNIVSQPVKTPQQMDLPDVTHRNEVLISPPRSKLTEPDSLGASATTSFENGTSIKREQVMATAGRF